MAAIQEDVLMGEEEGGEDGGAGAAQMDSEDEEDDYSRDEDKMDTVNEAGNETNQNTTGGKQPNSGSGGMMAGLRDIGELDGQRDEDEDYEDDDDGFEEKEDYEF